MNRVYLVLILLLLIIGGESLCPPEEDIVPCTCSLDSGDQVSVDCSFIEDQDTLERAVDGLEKRTVDYFAIKHSTLNYLPHDLFQDVHLRVIDLHDSSFISLSDRDTAFEGLEDTLEELFVIDCSLMAAWNWRHLKKMNALFRIDITGGDMDSIGEDISDIAHLPLIDLAITKNQVSWIQDKAFSKYENLSMLTLDYNQLTDLKRSMFPKPAPKLMLLSLSNNKLISLPYDFFTDFPALDTVDLSYNKFLTLNEKVFSSILGQLETLALADNKIRCDCRVAWILSYPRPIKFDARRIWCVEPPRLRGMSLTGLVRDDLWC